MKNKYIQPKITIEELSKLDILCSSQPATTAPPIVNPNPSRYETEEDW